MSKEGFVFLSYLFLELSDFFLYQFIGLVEFVGDNVWLLFALLELVADALKLVLLLLHFWHCWKFLLYGDVSVVLGELL